MSKNRSDSSKVDRPKIVLTRDNQSLFVVPAVRPVVWALMGLVRQAEADGDRGYRIVRSLEPLDIGLAGNKLACELTFEPVVRKVLKSRKYDIQDDVLPVPSLPAPAIERLKALEPVDRQVLEMVQRERYGLIRCTAEATMIRLIAQIALAWPTLRIAVVANLLRKAKWVRQQLKPFLGTVSVHSSRKYGEAPARVSVCTYMGLAGVNYQALDMVIALDAQEATNRRSMECLGYVRQARRYGFLAAEQRIAPRDQHWIRLLFGFNEVEVRDPNRQPRPVTIVPFSFRPRIKANSAFELQEELRRNPRRNLALAQIAQAVAQGQGDERLDQRPWRQPNQPQKVAILVQNLKHGLELAKLLPGWPLICSQDAYLGGLAPAEVRLLQSGNPANQARDQGQLRARQSITGRVPVIEATGAGLANAVGTSKAALPRSEPAQDLSRAGESANGGLPLDSASSVAKNALAPQALAFTDQASPVRKLAQVDEEALRASQPTAGSQPDIQSIGAAPGNVRNGNLIQTASQSWNLSQPGINSSRAGQSTLGNLPVVQVTGADSEDKPSASDGTTVQAATDFGTAIAGLRQEATVPITDDRFRAGSSTIGWKPEVQDQSAGPGITQNAINGLPVQDLIPAQGSQTGQAGQSVTGSLRASQPTNGWKQQVQDESAGTGDGQFCSNRLAVQEPVVNQAGQVGQSDTDSVRANVMTTGWKPEVEDKSAGNGQNAIKDSVVQLVAPQGGQDGQFVSGGVRASQPTNGWKPQVQDESAGNGQNAMKGLADQDLGAIQSTQVDQSEPGNVRASQSTYGWKPQVHDLGAGIGSSPSAIRDTASGMDVSPKEDVQGGAEIPRGSEGTGGSLPEVDFTAAGLGVGNDRRGEGLPGVIFTAGASASDVEPMDVLILADGGPGIPEIVYRIVRSGQVKPLVIIDFQDLGHFELARWRNSRKRAYAKNAWPLAGETAIEVRVKEFLRSRPKELRQ